jgi:hypothetical protein
LRLEQIYNNLDRFDGTRLRGLAQRQIEAFDYANPKFMQHHCNAIFPVLPANLKTLVIREIELINFTRRRLQLLGKDKLIQLWDKLDEPRKSIIDPALRSQVECALYK